MSKSAMRQFNAAKIKKTCMAALFCALAYASTFVFHLKVMFLTFDVKDAIVTLAGLLFGPIYAISISFLTALLEFISIGETGFWGLIMDFLSTATFSTVCALIYKYKKNIKGAIIGLISSVFAMTAIMILCNIFITPIYMGTTTTEVLALIPSLLLPFNFVKAVLNSAIVMILYKPISTALKAVKVLPGEARFSDSGDISETETKRKHIIFSVVVTAVGAAVIALCIFIFVFFMNGKFELI